jgi:hypothetical protein
MTASLLLFVSVALLALISGFCFVGCVLDTHGTGNPGPDPKPVPFTKYSGDDVVGNPSIAAYWPLSEDSAVAGKPVATAIAVEVIGGKNGNYTNKDNMPALFPCPSANLGAGTDTAAAIGSITLGVESIVAGDAKQPGNDPTILTTGMQSSGGFVTVPNDPVANPSPPFTIEAWARPDEVSPPAFRNVLDSRNINGNNLSGYGIWINEQGNWEGGVGVVGSTSYVLVTGPTAIKGAKNHVVLTCDGTSASLFVDGGSKVTSQLGAAFNANKVKPFVIGVGAPWLDPRMNSTGDLFFPVFPFNGMVQDVAIYHAVLSDEDILKHFEDGSGKTTVPAG